MRFIALLFVLAPIAAYAQPPGLTDVVPPPPADSGRDTSRAMFGAGMGVFANFPMSYSDPGVALFAAKPMWLGNRYRYFQWQADWNGVLGFGTEHMHAYLVAGPNIGPNFYFGSVFGLEFRMGLDGIVQLGERTVGGITLGMGAAYVFRFWDDDRKRIKLLMQMHMGGFIADDPGNDMGMNAGAMTLGLGYESPI